MGALRWWVWVPLAAAGAWSGLLVWAVGAVDVYSSEAISDDGSFTSAGVTLAEANGRSAYLVGAVPLLATLAVALLAAFGPRLTTAVAALCVVGVLGLCNLLAMLTVGVVVLPTTGALLVAVVAMLVRAGSAPRPATAVP